MIPELSFTPENLQRHLNCEVYTKYRTIYTTRNHKKGEPGDIFQIKDIGYFVLESVEDWRTWPHAFEGFKNAAEYLHEMSKIYPNFMNEVNYVHKFVKLNEENIQDIKFIGFMELC